MLNRIHHIGVAVREADAALGLYRDLLGLPVTKDAVLEAQGVRGVLLSTGETEIELLQPLRPDTPVGRFIESRGEGLHHLCFGTDDIEAELRTARQRGLPLIDERPRPGLAGMIAFLQPKATRGVLVEYAQPPEPAFPPYESPEGSAGVQAFDHVAVAVTDLDAGAQTFAANFDLVEDSRAELPVAGIRVASFPIGGSFIGVISPLSEDGPHAEFLRRRGEGLYLISLAVADLDRAVEQLRDRGMRLGEVVSPGPQARYVTVSPRDTHGVLLQLVERGDGARPGH